MRLFLHWLYVGCGALAVVSMVGIGILTTTSIVSRELGILIPGLFDYAGYAMAAMFFLGLAYAFGHGAHVRVTLLLHFLRRGPRRLAEIWCLSLGVLLAGYMAFFAIKMVVMSYEFNDVSQGPDATPLWIPQTPVAVGLVVLTIAMAHRLIEIALGAPLDPKEIGELGTDMPDARDG